MDCVTADWKALVIGDYEIVMPLPIAKKFGINYIYQPLFCQQLGVFSKEKISSKIIEDLLQFVSKKYFYVQLNLNYTNVFDLPLKNVFQKKNLILLTKNSHEKTQQGYSENVKRNLKRATNANLELSLNGNGFIEFYIQNTAIREWKF